MEMLLFRNSIRDALRDLDFVWAVNERMFGAAQKLYRVVEIATALFVYFLEIHPYANGNGHMTSRTSRLPI